MRAFLLFVEPVMPKKVSVLVCKPKNSPSWQISWIDDDGLRRRKSIGPIKEAAQHQAEILRRKLQKERDIKFPHKTKQMYGTKPTKPGRSVIKQHFTNAFVSCFMANIMAKHYYDYGTTRLQEQNTTPIEEAQQLAEKLWTQLLALGRERKTPEKPRRG
jgi:hypothetical protein